jgi:hypothetical protein
MPRYEVVTDRIARLRKEIEERHAEIWRLRRFISHPVVFPVMHWKEYTVDTGEVYGDYAPDTNGDLLRGAYMSLCGMLENGTGWPVGVSVGGAMITMDELDKMYPGVKDY